MSILQPDRDQWIKAIMNSHGRPFCLANERIFDEISSQPDMRELIITHQPELSLAKLQLTDEEKIDCSRRSNCFYTDMQKNMTYQTMNILIERNI